MHEIHITILYRLLEVTQFGEQWLLVKRINITYQTQNKWVEKSDLIGANTDTLHK